MTRLSFAVGIVMSINAGRDVGEDGSLLLSHGLGVHGIQAIPAVALLASTVGPFRLATWLLHAAGIGWLAASIAALTQAVLGSPPLDASFLTALIGGGLAVWVAVAGYSLLCWRRPGPPRWRS